MIELCNVSKIYQKKEKEIRALDNVSLSIKDNEFIAIVGASGSGKSTLLNILGCLDSVSRGSYILNGEDVAEMEPDELAQIRNKHIGFIFQNFKLIEHLTAIDNVQIPLIYGGVRRTERKKRAKEVLSIVGLSNRENHFSRELSGGQQQRLAIARAIALEHDIILADEPTGNLDECSCAEIMNMLEEIYKNGKTVIVVTHDKSVARKAGRVLEIREGKIYSDKQEE